ncbi:ATP-binding protein [Candidatus Micrarchaeota archaeon]|nr:ATP-binding protein [Candidatus Micrarchaeota archaeon]
MLLKETLRGIARDQMEELASVDYGLEREELGRIDLETPYAVVLSGIRRCGKSTLLRQIAKKTGRFYYFNFDDSQVAGFEVSDFQKLDEVFHEEFGDSDCYFFDEVQNVERWELFVRTGLDRGKRFVLTGSNASLLSKELGTRLTGRHLREELFPFSFGEALSLRKAKAGPASLATYLGEGGFPAYLRYGKAESLRELLNDVIERDIVVRHKLRDTKTVKELAVYLLTNTAREFTYNKIGQTFSLSTTTAASYVSFFEDAYLVFAVPKFAYSLRKQLVNPKKVYCIDNGLAKANSASFSNDEGRLLENAVFLHLRRHCRDIFYYKGKGECDFVVKDRDRISAAFQACYKLTEDNKQREVSGLLEALNEFDLKEGLILTFDQEDHFVLDGRKITVVPAWKWMLASKRHVSAHC